MKALRYEGGRQLGDVWHEETASLEVQPHVWMSGMQQGQPRRPATALALAHPNLSTPMLQNMSEQQYATLKARGYPPEGMKYRPAKARSALDLLSGVRSENMLPVCRRYLALRSTTNR